MRWLPMLLLLGCETGPVDESRPRSAAESALVQAGFTDIAITGDALLMCSDSDLLLTSRSFRATNARGHVVNGAVCCGLVFKNCTIRF